MPPSIRMLSPGLRVAVLLPGLLVVATTLHGSEPAPASGRPTYFYAQSILTAERLDEPVDTSKNLQLDKGVFELRGPIDAAMLEHFANANAAASEAITTVRITSQGGQITDALQIALIIEARHMDVVVRDFCTGACAQYIFVAGRKRRLEDQALVGFMNTIKSSGTVLAMATDTLQVQNTLESLTGRYAGLEEELYRRRGVAASLLLDPQVALQPTCVILRRNGRAVSWNTSSNYVMWVPSREYLNAAGVEFEGDWPKSKFWLGGLANRYMKTRHVTRVRYGDNDHLRSKKDPPYSLEDVRKCVLDEEPASAPPPG